MLDLDWGSPVWQAPLPIQGRDRVRPERDGPGLPRWRVPEVGQDRLRSQAVHQPRPHGCSRGRRVMATTPRLTHCCVCGLVLPERCRTNCDSERCREGPASCGRASRRASTRPCQTAESADSRSSRPGRTPVAAATSAPKRDLTAESAGSRVNADGRGSDFPDHLAYLDGPPIYMPEGRRPATNIALSKRGARRYKLIARLREVDRPTPVVP